jgi:hypothetical protein
MQQPSLPPAALQPQLRLKFACRAASALRYVDFCLFMARTLRPVDLTEEAA